MSLLVNLISYWKLDEGSGTRFDATTTNNDLTDNNNVGFADGKINSAANFPIAGSGHLSHLSNSSLQTGDIDFTFCGWIYLYNLTSSAMLSKWSGNEEYAIRFLAGIDRFEFIVDDGSGSTTVRANNFGLPVINTWHFICAWHDATANTINIQVNDGIADSTAHTTGVDIANSPFVIGGLGTTTNLADGRIDEVGFWKRILTSEERTKVYNNDNGLSYPFGVVPIEVPIEVSIKSPTRHQSTGLCVIIQDPVYFTNRTSYGRFAEQIQSLSFSIQSIGGYWDAKIKINYPLSEIENWIESGGNSGLGRHVVIYNPSLEIIWEGFVNGISAALGGITYKTGSLKDINNRISVTYSTTDTTTIPPTVGIRETTVVANDTDSQDQYGIIQKIIPKGGTTTVLAEQGRDAWLEDRKDPQVSTKDNVSGSSGPSLQLDCLGYWHWFDLYVYQNLVGGDVNSSDFIQTITSAQLNSIISTDFRQIELNTLQVPSYQDKNPKASSLLKTLNSFGDFPNNQYSIGVYQNRQLIYQQIPTFFDYQRRITSNENIIDRLQGIVEPWNILPAKWIFYPDLLTGRNPPVTSATLATDQRATFIQNIRFTAPNRVSISGERIGKSTQVFAKFGLAGQGT